MSKPEIGLPGRALQLLYFSRLITTSIPAQALLGVVFLGRPKLPRPVWGYLIIVAAYWSVVLLFNPSPVPLQNLLFYFSFLPAALVLMSRRRCDRESFVSDTFLVVMCWLTLAEAVILSSPLASHVSFFLPPNWATSSENVRLFGIYQRPLGIAGNASMTSEVLVFSAVLGDVVRGSRHRVFDRATVWLTIAVFALASGTGFGLLILYIIWRGVSRVDLRPARLAGAIATLAIPAAAVVGAFQTFNNIKGFDKFGSTYALLLLDQKSTRVTDAFHSNQSITTVLLGNQSDARTAHAETSDDFGFAAMYQAIGLLGAACVLGVPLLFASSLARFVGPTVFFYLTFVHYPGLLSPPGAVVFAVYLAILSAYSRRAVSISSV